MLCFYLNMNSLPELFEDLIKESRRSLYVLAPAGPLLLSSALQETGNIKTAPDTDGWGEWCLCGLLAKLCLLPILKCVYSWTCTWLAPHHDFVNTCFPSFTKSSKKLLEEFYQKYLDWDFMPGDQLWSHDSQLSAPLHCPGNSVDWKEDGLGNITNFPELNNSWTSPQPEILTYTFSFYTAGTNFFKGGA